MTSSDRDDWYPNAERVPIDARRDALDYVLGRVKESYGEGGIALRNVASLVDGVADAVVADDMQAAAVRGLRLLDIGEVDHVVGMLRSAWRDQNGALADDE